MALSKPVAVDLAMVLFRAPHRVAAPLSELAEDFCSVFVSWFSAPCSADLAAGLVSQTEDDRQGNRESSVPCPEQIVDDVAKNASWSESFFDCGKLYMPSGIMQALQELGEEFGHYATYAPLLLGALAAGPGVGQIVTSGLSISSKTWFALESLAFGIAAHAQYSRYPDLADQTMQRRACISLGACSALYMVLAVLGEAPPPLLHLAPSPEIFLHCMGDIIILPPLVFNLAHLAGVAPRDMSLCVLFIAGSSAVAALAAAAAPQVVGYKLLLLGAEISLLGHAIKKLHALTPRASAISLQNMGRVEVAGDLMTISLIMYPLAQSLGVAHILSSEQVLQIFAFLDIAGKLGVSHAMLRDRSTVQGASSYFIRVARAYNYQAPLGQSVNEEPCCEPPPGNA
mmetsp:Transcript_31959/g.84257  ORF Transcript_31959/g.84257 Transcript_31959/m.84257 type:complete len:399 (+) Transcript_31959:78-1274(+)